MKSKNILIISEDFPPYSGGIAQWAFGISKSLNNLNYTVTVFTRFREKFKTDEKNISFNINFIYGKNWKKFRTLYCYKAIKEYIETKSKPDYIIATTWNVARGLFSISKKYNVPIIIVVHGLEVTRKMNNIKKHILKVTLQKSFFIISVSNYVAQFLINNFGLDKHKVKVFPNGVDIDRFYPNQDTNKISKILNIQNSKIILTLARVIKRKGHDKVIKALPAVIKKIPNLKYIICGPYDKNYYDELKKIINKLNLNDYVIFTNYVPIEDISLYYNLADIYIMPSRYLKTKGDIEGFGITYLEANACEKPVIGGYSGGIDDAIVDGETGFLVNPNSIKEIEEKLILLLTDEVLAKKIGKKGRERIKSGFTWDAIAKRIAKELM